MKSEPMKIKALAPWFGAKRNLASAIIDQMGAHKVYWEPFCGSMAILLAKQPCEMETVNDLNGDLINLAKVIQNKELGLQLYDKLSRTLCAEQFFRESKERWISGNYQEFDDGLIDFDRAYDYFVASWMGLNGVSGTKRYNYQFALRWTIGGGQGAGRWKSVVGSIPAWHKRLRNVLIVQRDAFEILGKIKDEKGTVIYCDPPYFEKSDKYVHDFEAEDHKRLAQSLGRFEHVRVLVSYYDHPKLKSLYAGWNWIYLTQARQSLKNATRGGIPKPPRKPSAEILIVNKVVERPLF